MAGRLVDLRYVQTYIESVLPTTLTAKQQRKTLLRFYVWLFGEGSYRYGITFVCPHCKLCCGQCACPQLGAWIENGGQREWAYNSDVVSVTQWWLEVGSVTKIDPRFLNLSLIQDRLLAGFIAYLKRP